MFESKPFKRKERMITLLAWGTVLLPVMILLFGGIKALFWGVVCVGLVALIGVIIKYPLAALLALYLGIN
jgi:hypothetical protein